MNVSSGVFGNIRSVSSQGWLLTAIDTLLKPEKSQALLLNGFAHKVSPHTSHLKNQLAGSIVQFPSLRFTPKEIHQRALRRYRRAVFPAVLEGI